MEFIKDHLMKENPTPFFIFLQKTHVIDKYTSDKNTEYAKELQLYVTSGDKKTYRQREDELKKTGHLFRLTKGEVSEIKITGEKIEIQVALQVKGHSLTWYFWAPGAMDQYPQEFRDLLYNAAAKAHKQVKHGCDLYYRGSNAVHVKLMHHLETESGHNHNHYRLKDNKHYTPDDFNEHLHALAQSDTHDQFFREGEIEHICEQFNTFHANWVAKVDNQSSKEDDYFSQPSQQLDAADIIELDLFGQMQEPCRIHASELKVDYETARKQIEDSLKASSNEQVIAIKINALKKIEEEYNDLLSYRQIGGSRGLKSEIASTRQIKNSQNPVIKAVMGMDDALGKEVPEVPQWASHLQQAVESSKTKMIDAALKRLDPLENQENLSPLKKKYALSGYKQSFFTPQQPDKTQVSEDAENTPPTDTKKTMGN